MKPAPTATFIGGYADGREVKVIGQFMRGYKLPKELVPITDAQGKFERMATLEDRYSLHTVQGRHFYVEETIHEADVPDLVEQRIRLTK